eukprot:2476225-Rhodomonas_salina.1
MNEQQARKRDRTMQQNSTDKEDQAHHFQVLQSTQHNTRAVQRLPLEPQRAFPMLATTESEPTTAFGAGLSADEIATLTLHNAQINHAQITAHDFARAAAGVNVRTQQRATALENKRAKTSNNNETGSANSGRWKQQGQTAELTPQLGVVAAICETHNLSVLAPHDSVT